MAKLSISKKQLLSKYQKDINQLLDDCDWIDWIDDSTMIGTITSIVNKSNKNGTKIESQKLLKLYKEKIKSLKLTDQEYRDQYADWKTGVPKLVDMAYDLIEEKL